MFGPTAVVYKYACDLAFFEWIDSILLYIQFQRGSAITVYCYYSHTLVEWAMLWVMFGPVTAAASPENYHKSMDNKELNTSFISLVCKERGPSQTKQFQNDHFAGLTNKIGKMESFVIGQS